MSVDPSTFSPRERARHLAAHGAIDLVRVLVVAALALGVAVVVTVLATDPPPALSVAAAAVRGLLALGLTRALWRLRPWSRPLGLGPWLALGLLLALVAAAAAALAALGVAPPDALAPAVWPTFLATIGHLAFAGALMLALQVSARFASREGLGPSSRTLARAPIAVVGALVAGIAVLDPALLPTLWLGPAVALATPWALVAARTLEWRDALFPTLFVGAVVVLLFFMGVPPMLPIGLGALAALGTAAIAPRHGLAELAAVLGEEPTAAPSRTFIRRLLDGPDASQLGSRLGSQPVSSNPDDSLALAYRELGIEPPKPSTRPAPAPAAEALPASPAAAPATPAAPAPAPTPKPELPPMPPMAKLEPVPRPPTRGALRPVLTLAPPLPPDPARSPDAAESGAWSEAALGLHHYFLGFIGRAVTLVVSFMLAQGPIGKHEWARMLELGVLAAAGAVEVAGLLRLQRMPARASARGPARLATALTMVKVLFDLALLASVGLALDLTLPLVIADAFAFVAGTAALLVALRRLLTDLGAERARSKAAAVGLQLALFVTFGVAAALVGGSSDSELAWLSLPAGLATAVLGLSYFVSTLWLVTDARTSIVDWQVRVRRAHAPDVREDGDPDPAA